MLAWPFDMDTMLGDGLLQVEYNLASPQTGTMVVCGAMRDTAPRLR
jgi:hypothetical protein